MQVLSLQTELSEARRERQQALRQVEEAKFAFRLEEEKAAREERRRILRETMTELASRAASSSGGDEEDSTITIRGAGRPRKFSGIVSEFTEWSHKVTE